MESDEIQDTTGGPEREPLDEDVAEGETETERNLEAEKDDSSGEGDDGEGAGPAEDIQNDPAYNPDDPELKGIKGG